MTDEQFITHHSGLSLDGRLIALCDACRQQFGPLAFQRLGSTVVPCVRCGAPADGSPQTPPRLMP